VQIPAAARIKAETMSWVFLALSPPPCRASRRNPFALENVSGNNANSQTTAFKRIDSSFVDLIPDEQASKQLAGQVVAQSRATDTVQGDIQSASIDTFMAINGDGYFVIQKPSNFADGRPVFDGAVRSMRSPPTPVSTASIYSTAAP
jgi:hypothetical protein